MRLETDRVSAFIFEDKLLHSTYIYKGWSWPVFNLFQCLLGICKNLWKNDVSPIKDVLCCHLYNIFRYDGKLWWGELIRSDSLISEIDMDRLYTQDRSVCWWCGSYDDKAFHSKSSDLTWPVWESVVLQVKWNQALYSTKLVSDTNLPPLKQWFPFQWVKYFTITRCHSVLPLSYPTSATKC